MTISFVSQYEAVVRYYNWLGGRVVMQRPAKPCTAVRFRSQPPNLCSSLVLWVIPLSSPGGEIGRRKGLKIPRSNIRAGSSPAPGTRK